MGGLGPCTPLSYASDSGIAMQDLSTVGKVKEQSDRAGES